MPDFTLRTVVVGPVSTNCYILSAPDRDDCLVIDPGEEAARIREACDGRRVAAILLTHAHFDHIGAVDALMGEDTRLYVHEDDAAMLASPELNASWLMGEPVVCRAQPRTVREGTVFEAAGLTCRVLHTPGHTPGSVCYLIGNDLFTGDTLFDLGYGRTDLPGGSMADMRQSLRRLMPLREVHPIHGGHS